MKIGVIGAGEMGSGIAQVVSQAGHNVVLTDLNQDVLKSSASKLEKIMARLVEKGRITQDNSTAIQGRIQRSTDLKTQSDCSLVIEAVVENMDVKKAVFNELETIVSDESILASNTSSLSITSIAKNCRISDRVIGLHFFNPAPLMPLVEIIPALQTKEVITDKLIKLMIDWGKSPVLAKDTPGFIVNRVARPFYSESLRILEEGLADVDTIDSAMRDKGFRMGPFELMDLIGHDVNYAVTESVFKSFYYDPRYKPSLTQLKLVEANWLGKKSGRGFYKYINDGTRNFYSIGSNKDIQYSIAERVIAMLINEAADAVFWDIASAEDIDTAMTKGVNYPKGLLKWADEWGASKVINIIDSLSQHYGDSRYRVSPILREMARSGEKFYG
ncbi:MAG: 3-hydroxybutyryl-CoA dehydrogenase [Crocinitomicaceae bacterium]|nr:3-hydroxybutyryl-CoA dehydrogenase [Crocinitomicaceae bacterium]|tara:strand:+ start:16329 stop:17489 length:1161 start_codon:yes stop_codon:yes gene_type:complete